ncbi:cardiac-enriched FHL2-interacting protein isoform X2 [Etheostoma spectabile]|uniref:cardiac-enriched FHL2-interacting protein isoform X2 n=1 Tax=Etheostoma spectabile TaxID=54343 RepID=UPI0013AF2CCD|nr:cardiac-enriched FHL2-interacting protein-like isoform X2 [Etheostoma spectabile]
MTCVEKRHMNHRVGSMLHHRFPNGFTDMLMDETDREVSTLTDRAFRSLCVGDDAVFNDEFLYGYSPFNCHKPLVGEPLKKTHHKESKKQGQNKTDKNYAQQQHKNISHISSFLKALSATEESCEGMLIKNGGMPDTNVESWDKSALRSIQRELSDFSSDYHTNLTEGHHKNHHRHHTVDGFLNKTGKNAALPSEKFSKSQNGKSTVKLRKLNIKNFFLHSEFSPFQSWRDFKQFPFGQEETSILPLDKIPKWYDLPFYKELTEAHRKETQHTEEAQSCQKAAPPLTAPKPIPPPPPPKVLPKPIATMADKRCSSDGGDGSAAPWRRNRSRARSVIPVNQPSVNSSGKQQVYSDSSPHDTSPVKERWDVVNKSITGTDGVICDSILPSTYLQSENRLCLSPEFKGNEKKVIILQDDMSPIRETIFNNSNVMAKETPKVKRKAPLRPDHLNTPDYNVNKKFVAGEPNKINRAIEEIHVDTEALCETHRDILSPLLLVNGKSVNQSPPDQASLSSKSSYFSVESTLNRNTETGSNVYHSLENLIGEEEEVDEVPRNSSRNTKQDSDRMEVEYYSLSDHESEPEVKRQIKCPQKETEVPYKDSKERDNTTSDKSVTYEENNSTPMSPSNTFSLSLGIPALFKVKDITLSNKLIKTVQPWSPRESLSGSERVEELDQVQGNPELLPATEPATRGSTPIPAEIFKPKAISSKSSPPLLLSPLNLQSENPKKPQAGGFLTVPQEEDRLSGVSPSSEGVESLTTSTADTAEEMGKTAEVSKVPSERSGSTCSGNESQTGLPKPPVVLPKSEKAVLKAIKLANRRMKKEEAQKSSHRSSQSGSKHRVDRHKSDKPEPKSSSGQSSKSSERNHREKMEDGRHHNESHHGKTSDDQSEQIHYERRGHRGENQTHDRTCKTRRQSHDSAVSITENNEAPPSVATERQGRRSNRHIREKPEQRPYSSDRVISNVPVYKAQLSERPTTDRPINRSQSIDRYSGDQVECRPSVDKSVNEKFDPRTQRIEKSIVDGLQQRGRAREKASTHTLLRRSHSIDSYPNPNPHPSSLSRQSSHTSQLSRQSSIEHTIVTQSFPMTQRKLLQDPDSGQYFFVDMPVQVKTKTFFDPETRSYVQLPVQPPEGAVPQASPLEVLTQPLVVYHSFVPVPLSPMAQKTPIQAPHMEPRLRQMHCKDGHPYLEPVYSQHDHMLGEFLGTEEVDCPS